MRVADRRADAAVMDDGRRDRFFKAFGDELTKPNDSCQMTAN
jgi:hypothetical protein